MPAVALALGAVACGEGGDRTEPTAATQAATDPTEAWSAVLDARREALGAPGALLAGRRDGHGWTGASGAADVAGTPLSPGARFRIASITKPVVALLALDAVARGELALDEPVGPPLADLLPDDDAITLRMLLDHTSGIFAVGDEGDLAADIGRLTDPGLQAEATSMAQAFLAGEPVAPSVPLLVALAETHERYAPPGEGYHYSNVNYLLVGVLLERVTGQSLAELLRTRVAEPLGLRHTTISPPDTTEPDLVGYARSPSGELVDPGYAHLLLLGNGAAGGIVSTTDELLEILRAAVAGDVVPEPLVAEMTRPSPASGGQAYGLGLATYTLSCGTFLGHEGGIAGTASIALVAPDGQDGVVIALNLRGPEDPGLPALADELLCG